MFEVLNLDGVAIREDNVREQKVRQLFPRTMQAADKFRLANRRAVLLQDARRFRTERDYWQQAMDDALDEAQRIKEQMEVL